MGWKFPEQRYTCIQCGKSCGGWRIWVEPERLATLRAHPLALEQAVLQEEPEGGHSLKYDQDGRCHFLREDRLCALHADSGWDSKPRVCRQFPFFLLETPDGLQVGVSFRCSAVQQNQGVEWERHAPDLERLRAGADYPRIGFVPARLGAGELAWAEYQEWEREWLTALEAAGPFSLAVWRRLQPKLGLLLDPASFESLLQAFASSAVGYLEGSIQPVSLAIQAGAAYTSPRRGAVGALSAPWHGSDAEVRRYLRHALERKTLWWDHDFLGRLLMLLIAEKLLCYYRQQLGPAAAFDLVEGEWLGHTDQRDLAAGFRSALLQFC